MNDELETLLIQCLDELEAGASPEAILARYPEAAEQIRPILLVAGRLSDLSATPPVSAQAAAQDVFLAQAAAIRQAGARPRFPFWSRRLGFALASLLFILVAVFGLVQGSAEALPGDPLYTVKRARENVQLALTDDPNAVLVLQDAFNDERIREVKGLLAAGREADVSCHGEVETIHDGSWQVYGVDLYLDPTTKILGRPSVGDTVAIRGRVENGRFVASEIVVETEAEDTTPVDPPPMPAVPSPTPTSSPTRLPEGAPDNDADSNSQDDDSPAVPTDSSGSGSGDDNDDDNSGSGNGDDDDDDDDDDNSGSGNRDNDDDNDDDDNSGSGNGDDDDDDDDDDNSGSGNGDDDDDDDDNSGSGSGDDDDDD